MSEKEKPEKTRQIVTRAGAFGERHAILLIIRRWVAPKKPGEKATLAVENFVLKGAGKAELMQQAHSVKNKVIKEPDFASITILKFVEESRILNDTGPEFKEKSKIIIPNFRERNQFGKG